MASMRLSVSFALGRFAGSTAFSKRQLMQLSADVVDKVARFDQVADAPHVHGGRVGVHRVSITRGQFWCLIVIRDSAFG